MKGLFLVVLIVLILSNTSCQKPKHKIEDLNGTWERIESSDNRYLGMKIMFKDKEGTVESVAMDSSGYFEVGVVKWTEITPVVSLLHEYEFQELSSKNTYYGGTIDLYPSKDTLKIVSDFRTAPGSEQIWVRR